VDDAEYRDWRGVRKAETGGQECPPHTFPVADGLSTCQAQEMQRGRKRNRVSLGVWSAPNGFILLATYKMKLFKPIFNQPRGTPSSALHSNPVRRYASCDCLAPQYKHQRWEELKIHSLAQDTTSEAWQALEQYISAVEASGGNEMNPIEAIGPERWGKIIVLPRSIKNLKSVKYLGLYGSHLVRIPPEIGEMTNLEEFDPYTSYCLHWFPYEITRCRRLRLSRVSTRALYGNYKYRPPFPRLPAAIADIAPECCSVCEGAFKEGGPRQVWISLRVATDVLPLLVHACSEECVAALPNAPLGYVERPHRGGLQVRQPPPKP